MAPPKIVSAEFALSVHRAADFPPARLPEVAFLGRSNVGKSSLLNTLLTRRRLVRTSARPGCTRGLNFFLVNRAWYWVDLPGYGYAAVSWREREGWGPLIMEYLMTRPTLKAVVFLHDPRRTPGEEELFLWEKLRGRGLPVLPVLTKADKLKPGERARRLPEIAAALAPFHLQRGDFIWCSALTREGRETLWHRLLACLEERRGRN